MENENKWRRTIFGKEGYDYFTYPRNFASYKWFKPILVFILFVVFYMIFNYFLLVGLGVAVGDSFDILRAVSGGYDDLDVATLKGGIISIGIVALMLPALALAARIVKDRPYSSYSSARGGWSFKIFFLSLLVALIIYAVKYAIDIAIDGVGTIDNHFTIAGLIFLTIVGPIQCVAEEYMFRGLLMQTISSWFRLPIIAIIIQVVIFISMHPYNIKGRIAVGVSAFIFAICAWAGRGLEVSSGLHVVNNMFAFYISGLGVGNIQSEVGTLDLISSISLEVIYLIVMLILIKKCSWFHEMKRDDISKCNEKWLAKKEKRNRG